MAQLAVKYVLSLLSNARTTSSCVENPALGKGPRSEAKKRAEAKAKVVSISFPLSHYYPNITITLILHTIICYNILNKQEALA